MIFTAFGPIYRATCSLLPARMDSDEARAMLIAIALQESRFQHRVQIKGPARGFWQFELGGGIRGVLNHSASKQYIRSVLDALCYDYLPDTSYLAVMHNDVLACAYARLLLWTLPEALPPRDDPEEAWAQYQEAWRPGKPHPETWKNFYEQAWILTDKGAT
jgi:hypothetical protein